MRARISAYVSDRDPSSRNITRLQAGPTNRYGYRLVSPTAPSAVSVTGGPAGTCALHMSGGPGSDPRREIYDNGARVLRDAPADPRVLRDGRRRCAGALGG